MLTISRQNGTTNLEADDTTMQIVLSATIDTLLTKGKTPEHRKLYSEICEVVRSRAPWPLTYDIVPPEECLRRLHSADAERDMEIISALDDLDDLLS
jgi:hypothetical protein